MEKITKKLINKLTIYINYLSVHQVGHKWYVPLDVCNDREHLDRVYNVLSHWSSCLIWPMRLDNVDAAYRRERQVKFARSTQLS